MKLTADRTSRIVGVFDDCVKQNLLKHNTLSKTVTPQLDDNSACITDVTHRDTRRLDILGHLKGQHSPKRPDCSGDSDLTIGTNFIGRRSLDDLAKSSGYPEEIEIFMPDEMIEIDYPRKISPRITQMDANYRTKGQSKSF